MAEAVVRFLLENLVRQTTYEFNLITGAVKELEMLIDEVARLKDFAQDLARIPKKEERLKQLETEIRSVVYEVEDTIGVCTKKNFSRRILKRDLKSLREDIVKPILHKIEGLRSTVADAREEEHLTKPISVIRERIVGFKDEEQSLVSHLLEENGGLGKTAELDVVSITGKSGLGKTTLAMKIYHNDEIAVAFPIRIWIHVSRKLNTRSMLLQILEMFTCQDMSSMSEAELRRNVHSCLEQEKFLLVLDDVCSLQDWKAIIESILPASNANGKVLITTSERSVGESAGKPHELRHLTDAESWELLRLEVIKKIHDFPKELESIGEDIARKCGGLPLEVLLVAGVLVDCILKPRYPVTTVEAWKNVNSHFHDKMTLSDVVELNYSELPSGLRECFLYMGMFPEDYEIPTWTLVRLWIAEGFIKHSDGMSLEETATLYLNDLISRNLVMASKTKANGEVKTCRVHDKIHKFCFRKAQEQNLFEVIEFSPKGVLNATPSSDLQNCLRLCVDSNGNGVLPKLPEIKKARSFLYFNKRSTAVDPECTSSISDAFKLLKVLESKSLRFDRIPRGITRLFHLRYITLCVHHLTTLPETFSDLWNLQTLVVDTGSRVITMKANIWRLMRLRHLKTKAAIVLDLKMTGEAGEDLQTLDRLSPESCTPYMCEKVRKLKTLGIRGKMETLFTKNWSLSKLDSLEKLKLLNEPASENPPPAPQQSFFPPNLRSLTLSKTFLHWKHMSTLATLSKLESLKLKDNAFTGIYWSATDYQFTNLSFLLISNVDLVQWEAPTSSFNRLKCLVLNNCESLNVIPSGFGKTLEKLDIDGVRKSVVQSARKMEEENKKKAQKLEKDERRVPFVLSIGPACLA